MDIFKKIQDQPKHTRKIIFWVVIIIVGTLFLISWIYSAKIRIETAKPREIFEQLKPPSFEEDAKKIPKIELPEPPDEFSEEELKQLEEWIKEQKAQEEIKEQPSSPEAP